MALSIHADRGQLAVVDGAALQWQPSPTAGVERRMLERIGDEVALATTLVRYAPGSRFPAHVHELGEEFLVLEGTFSDESGDYPPGSYVRNPPGSQHAPYSDTGCVIFVKLRQMQADEPEFVRLQPRGACWRVEDQPGIRSMPLYANERLRTAFLRMEAGAQLPDRAVTGGEETFVLEGEVQIGGERQGRWGWRRNAARQQPAIVAVAPTLLWLKRGHL